MLTYVPQLWVRSSGRLKGTLEFASSKATELDENGIQTGCLATGHVEHQVIEFTLSVSSRPTHKAPSKNVSHY